jgi:Zn-dependent protease
MALLVAADVGHAIAHVFSARRAGAPMDAIELSANMPRTVYTNNDVPPKAHRGRAIGGPIYSGLALLLGLLARALTKRSSTARELADWWSIGNAFIFFGSLTPTPSVDGGSLLKWHLAERTGDEEAAERTVRRAGLTAGGAMVGAGLGLALRGRRLPAVVLGGWGIFTIVDTLGWAREVLSDRGFGQAGCEGDGADE